MSVPIRLSDGSTTLDIYPPVDGLVEDIVQDAARVRTLDGTEYVYIFGEHYRLEIDFRRLAAASAAQLNAWWEAGTLLACRPDMPGAPDTVYAGYLQGDERPCADMNPPYYDVSYAGRLVFEQSPGETAPGGGV